MTTQPTTTEAALEACHICGGINGEHVYEMHREGFVAPIPAPSVAPVVDALTEDEIRVLTDYHYYEAEKAITRRGDRASQQRHLERLAILRAAPASTVAPDNNEILLKALQGCGCKVDLVWCTACVNAWVRQIRDGKE